MLACTFVATVIIVFNRLQRFRSTRFEHQFDERAGRKIRHVVDKTSKEKKTDGVNTIENCKSVNCGPVTCKVRTYIYITFPVIYNILTWGELKVFTAFISSPAASELILKFFILFK